MCFFLERRQIHFLAVEPQQQAEPYSSPGKTFSVTLFPTETEILVISLINYLHAYRFIAIFTGYIYWNWLNHYFNFGTSRTNSCKLYKQAMRDWQTILRLTDNETLYIRDLISICPQILIEVPVSPESRLPWFTDDVSVKCFQIILTSSYLKPHYLNIALQCFCVWWRDDISCSSNAVNSRVAQIARQPKHIFQLYMWEL